MVKVRLCLWLDFSTRPFVVWIGARRSGGQVQEENGSPRYKYAHVVGFVSSAAARTKLQQVPIVRQASDQSKWLIKLYSKVWRNCIMGPIIFADALSFRAAVRDCSKSEYETTMEV